LRLQGTRLICIVVPTELRVVVQGRGGRRTGSEGSAQVLGLDLGVVVADAGDHCIGVLSILLLVRFDVFIVHSPFVLRHQPLVLLALLLAFHLVLQRTQVVLLGRSNLVVGILRQFILAGYLLVDLAGVVLVVQPVEVLRILFFLHLQAQRILSLVLHIRVLLIFKAVLLPRKHLLLVGGLQVVLLVLFG